MATTASFYATFGMMYEQQPHPFLPATVANPNGVVAIDTDDYEDARALIHYFAGPFWAFVNDWDSDAIERYYPHGVVATIGRDQQGTPTITTEGD